MTDDEKDLILKKFNTYFAATGYRRVNNAGLIDCSLDVTMIKPAPRFPVRLGKIGGYFSCSNMGLVSLEGAPSSVGEDFECEGNIFLSLQGLPSIIAGKVWIDYNPKLPLLRLLFAKKGVKFTESSDYNYVWKISRILNQFAGQGKRGVLPCTKALLTLEKELGKDIRANIKW